MKRALALIVFMALALTGCASYDVAQDKTAVEVEGYLVLKTDKKLSDCHQAGKSGWGGVGNDIFEYPAGQRTYSFTGGSSEEKVDPIQVVTLDSQTFHQPGFITFRLTNNCDDLYAFHTQIGLKYREADEKHWWQNFLADYLNVPLTQALNGESGKLNAKPFYQSGGNLTPDDETGLVKEINAKIATSLGSSKWLTVSGVSLSKPIAPQGFTDGLEASVNADLAKTAQNTANETNKEIYQTLKDCKDKGISEETCRIVYLALTKQVPFYPLPLDGSLVVNPK